MASIIDKDGFRLNVGIIITGDDGRLFWGRRLGKADAWQFPQGGMQEGETPEESMYRELEEETGLTADDVEIVAQTQDWLSYRLPKRFQRRNRYRRGGHYRNGRRRQVCIGQRQKWFLLRLASDESRIDLARSGHPEFQGWRWVNYWYPKDNVVHFKRNVYINALKELSPAFKALRGRRHA